MAAAIAAAFLLDLLLGDPRWLPHPVVAIGRLIRVLEEALPRWLLSRRLAGVLLTVVTVGLTMLLAWGALRLAALLHPVLYWPLWIGLGWTCLATRSLHRESAVAILALRAGDLPAARAALAMLVSRETAALDDAAVLRASLETVAENSSDGIVAPLFYLCLGGPVLALGYKAASTLDSMVGYRNDKYREFGWASARLDDLLNLIPARLTVLCMALAALPLRLRPLAALRISWRDGGQSKSPNAGYPMAAAAGALGVQLGGPAVYFGQVEMKPTLGEALVPLALERYDELIRLLYGTALCALAFGLTGVLLWR